jgi:LmbE family N-acetylglucosaminyl deacetylase
VKGPARPRWFGILLLVIGTQASAQFPAAPGTGPGLPETIEAIDSARVTTRILYITAHPDDESSAVLTYLARSVHADVALLSLTRGEGGQNALGPEQAPQLGLIRTQELLAATRGYGIRLFFTRARDFGFSKTPEETEKIWGDAVVEDMVRVMRSFRPNIVINGWGGVHTGHGHHQASGLLTPKAVSLAADPLYRLGGGSGPRPGLSVLADEAPWKITTVLDLDRGDPPKGYVLPLDEISPLYGKSWREIGLDAFVNHHTQGIAGFLNSPFLRRKIGLVPENGASFEPAQLAEPLTKLVPGCKAFEHAYRSLALAREAAMQGDISSATRELAGAATDFNDWTGKCGYAVTDTATERQVVADIGRSQKRIERALALAAGIRLKAESDTSELVAGDSFHVSARTTFRSEAQGAVGPLALDLPKSMTKSAETGDADQGYDFTIAFTGKAPPPEPGQSLLATEPDGMGPLLPEPAPLVTAEQQVTVAGYKMTVREPVSRVEATSTSVVRVPLRVVPAYTVSVEPKQTVEVLSAERRPFDIFLRVHSYCAKPATVSVGLDLPDGFTSAPPVELSFTGIGDQYVKLAVAPPAKLDPGTFAITAYAKLADEKFSTSLEPLPSMPTLLWSEPAQTVVHAFDINVPAKLRVGYISAEGEPIPDALRRLGIAVEMLDTAALTFGNLSRYDAVVVGVRAYELRPELAEANKRLLAYVSSGGTLVVQYNRDYVWNKFEPAPYPAKIGNPSPRITDENSPVRFLKPDDPLLNHPNLITVRDFKNWVQERGLYFWNDFDARYTPLLAMNDPGEKDLNGGLVYTRYGKGMYIYTGLAFFRELPEGVPGAYRLFVNLLAASKAN